VPLIEIKGTPLGLRRRTDEEPGWVYGVSPGGKEGWVPRALLAIEGMRGTLKEDYDATELSFEPGERLNVTRVLNGWYWCRNDSSEEGWVPARLVKMVKPAVEDKEDPVGED
jgi:hypothetical protein